MVAVYALAGVLAGALVNLGADQFPYEGGLRKRPRCAYCEQPRALWAWVSLPAYLQLKPQCRHCGAPLPLRPPLVELGMAILFAFLWQRFGPAALAGLYSIYSALLVLILVVDLEHRLIPNSIIYPAWGLGLLGSLLQPEVGFLRSALIGGVLGFGLLLIAHWLGRLFVTGARHIWNAQIEGPALGLGDVRLGAFVGLILGAPQVLTALLFAILLGGLSAGLYWFLHAVVLRRYRPFTVIPYGPYLVVGAMITLLFAPEISRGLLVS